jgi:integral membrane protein
MKSSLRLGALRQMRYVGLAEGVSYLLLLGISMPLKYLASFPEAVLVNGWIHGVLFVAYGLVSLRAWYLLRRPFGWLLLAGIASLLPFGTFWLDQRLKREQDAEAGIA